VFGLTFFSLAIDNSGDNFYRRQEMNLEILILIFGFL